MPATGMSFTLWRLQGQKTKKLTYQGVYQAAQKAANAGHGYELPLWRGYGQVGCAAGHEQGPHVGQPDGHPAQHAGNQACQQKYTINRRKLNKI